MPFKLFQACRIILFHHKETEGSDFAAETLSLRLAQNSLHILFRSYTMALFPIWMTTQEIIFYADS
jgi:hypothetical protein